MLGRMQPEPASRPTEQPAGQQPAFRVVRGTPTPQELAVLVGVLLGRRPESAPAPVARSQWRASARPVAPGVRPGPGAWRASTLPR